MGGCSADFGPSVDAIDVPISNYPIAIIDVEEGAGDQVETAESSYDVFVPDGQTSIEVENIDLQTFVDTTEIATEVEPEIVQLPSVSVVPDSLEFSSSVGCASNRKEVCVYNNGDVPFSLDHVDLSGCSDFHLVDGTGLPRGLDQNGSFHCFGLKYQPNTKAADSCKLEIKANVVALSPIQVPLHGVALPDAKEIEEFIQDPGQPPQFFLSHEPVQDTISVWINNEECASGWVYDNTSNSIILGMESPACLPDDSQTNSVKIAYEKTCGRGLAMMRPNSLDFKETTIGCYSQTKNVEVYNSKISPFSIEDVSLHGCSDEFKLNEFPSLPLAIGEAFEVDVKVVYHPQDAGSDECSLHIKTSDGFFDTLVVPVKGAGTFETEYTDEFAYLSRRSIDLLLVVNDSETMCDEQVRLLNGINNFIIRAQEYGIDYHIGIISADIADDAVAGKLNRGDAGLLPRFVTPMYSPSSIILSNLIGDICDKQSYAMQSGLEASLRAISAPLTTDTLAPCDADADCRDNPLLCAQEGLCQYYCIEGACGGWNKGFLRDDAKLDIIYLSDSDDVGKISLDHLQKLFINAKGVNQNLVNLHAIVGPLGGCETSEGEFVDPAFKYIKTADIFTGAIGSICDDSYFSIMQDISDTIFVKNKQYFLKRLADNTAIPPIRLWKNDQEMVDGWVYDVPSNSIIFDEFGSAIPKQGDSVKVKYKMRCYNN